MSQALLLMDQQDDCVLGGAMELVGSPAAGEWAGRLCDGFRQKGLSVFTSSTAPADPAPRARRFMHMWRRRRRFGRGLVRLPVRCPLALNGASPFFKRMLGLDLTGFCPSNPAITARADGF